MNSNKSMIGLALIGLAAAMVYLLIIGIGVEAERLFGKVVWYLPYVSLVGAVRFFCAE